MNSITVTFLYNDGITKASAFSIIRLHVARDNNGSPIKRMWAVISQVDYCRWKNWIIKSLFNLFIQLVVSPSAFVILIYG